MCGRCLLFRPIQLQGFFDFLNPPLDAALTTSAMAWGENVGQPDEPTTIALLEHLERRVVISQRQSLPFGHRVRHPANGVVDRQDELAYLRPIRHGQDTDIALDPGSGHPSGQ